MLESATNVYAFHLGFCLQAMADIPDEQMTHAPAPGVNPPAWILGHLCFAGDLATKLVGGTTKVCPAAWATLFAPGSDPATLTPTGTPTKTELLSAATQLRTVVPAAIAAADPARLAQPHGISYFANSPLLTVADAVTMLLTGHEGFHLGQLSAWRRLMGRKPLF